jgi:proline dehydrogenase
VDGTARHQPLEDSLRQIGHDLHDALPRRARHPVRALDSKAMELASRDAELRAALFRLVDVTPACRSLDDLARHLTGYLEELEEPPQPVETATSAASRPR